jgi:amino acid adenylation domain-containing protein
MLVQQSRSFQRVSDQAVLLSRQGVRAAVVDRLEQPTKQVPFNRFELVDIEQSVPDRFEQQVRKYPHQLAIKTPTEALTYSELNQIANRIARTIVDQRGSEPEPVVLLFDQGATFITAILGALKAGKIYIPVDPTFPAARNALILENSQAELVITNTKNLATAQELVRDRGVILNIDDIPMSVATDNLNLDIGPDTLAYVIYTSGSTGTPKGAVHNHRNVLHNCMTQTNIFNLRVGDRMTLLPSCSVMGAARCLFNAILNGVTLYPLNVKTEGLLALRQLLIEERITILYLTASLFRNFATVLAGNESFDPLRLIILGGEATTRQDFELFKQYFPDHCVLDTGLGSTEAGTISCHSITKQTRVDTPLLPVGKLVEGMSVNIVDEAGTPVPLGEMGEIVLRSPYLALGYWQQPEQTKKAFIGDPTNRRTRTFRTGDLGRILPNGILVHMGRKDFQVKVRGFRIDVSEIELVLLNAAAVKDAVVIGRDQGNGETQLIAYVVAAQSALPTAWELRDLVSRHLPSHMVPQIFVWLDALPRTPNGKIDRRSLPAPVIDRAPEHSSVEPSSPLEAALVKIWAEVLEVPAIGVQDNFFDLGGQSLLMARVVAQIEQELGQSLPPSVLFEAPTIQQLAQRLVRTEHLPSGVIEFQLGQGYPPLFCFPGAGDHTLFCQGLVRHLATDQPIYALREVPPTWDTSIEEIATQGVQAMQALQPTGPYFITGYSFGGLVAFEAAQQLRAQGQEVALLALLDPSQPTSLMGAVRAKLKQLPGGRQFYAPFFWINRLEANWFRWSYLNQAERLTYLGVMADKLRQGLNLVGQRRQKSGQPEAISPDFNPATAPAETLHALEISGWFLPYRRLVDQYVPRRYDATLKLFLSEMRSHDAGHWGNWYRLASEIATKVLPGTHHTIVQEPHVQVFAETMREYLQELI